MAFVWGFAENMLSSSMAAEDDAHQATPYLCVDREQLDRNLAGDAGAV